MAKLTEQKRFIMHCIDFQQSCNANGVPCELIITKDFVRVICRPKNTFEEHFEYNLSDSFESLINDISGDIEYIIEEHYKIDKI